jgi:hypothetical protein
MVSLHVCPKNCPMHALHDRFTESLTFPNPINQTEEKNLYPENSSEDPNSASFAEGGYSRRKDFLCTPVVTPASEAIAPDNVSRAKGLGSQAHAFPVHSKTKSESGRVEEEPLYLKITGRHDIDTSAEPVEVGSGSPKSAAKRRIIANEHQAILNEIRLFGKEASMDGYPCGDAWSLRSLPSNEYASNIQQSGYLELSRCAEAETHPADPNGTSSLESGSTKGKSNSKALPMKAEEEDFPASCIAQKPTRETKPVPCNIFVCNIDDTISGDHLNEVAASIVASAKFEAIKNLEKGKSAVAVQNGECAASVQDEEESRVSANAQLDANDHHETLTKKANENDMPDFVVGGMHRSGSSSSHVQGVQLRSKLDSPEIGISSGEIKDTSPSVDISPKNCATDKTTVDLSACVSTISESSSCHVQGVPMRSELGCPETGLSSGEINEMSPAVETSPKDCATVKTTVNLSPIVSTSISQLCLAESMDLSESSESKSEPKTTGLEHVKSSDFNNHEGKEQDGVLNDEPLEQGAGPETPKSDGAPVNTSRVALESAHDKQDEEHQSDDVGDRFVESRYGTPRSEDATKAKCTS